MGNGRKGAVGVFSAVAPAQDISVSKVVLRTTSFVCCLAAQGCGRLPDIQGTSGWSRKSACGYASSLRAFFYYAEQRGWCKPGIAEGIISPRLYTHEGLPEGPQWKQVLQLVKGVKGNSTVALRAKAVLLLLTVYGLRSGEISRLLLSDFDWRLETFTVNHSKRGGIQKYPLQREVGDAILEYIRKARPETSCRNLFLTLNPPYRGIGHSSLWRITSLRIDAAGIQCRRRGPHCLRQIGRAHAELQS